MTDKEFRRLSRPELIDIILELQQQYEQCKDEKQQLKQALEKKELDISNAGSLAEAVVSINGVMEAAQAAADQYLLSVKAASENSEQILASAKVEAERLVHDAQENATRIEAAATSEANQTLTAAKAKAEQTVRDAQEKAKQVEASAMKSATLIWDDFHSKVSKMMESYKDEERPVSTKEDE